MFPRLGLCALALAPFCHAAPPVVSSRPWAEIAPVLEKEQRLIIVQINGKSCAPCDQRLAAWSDPRILGFIGENAEVFFLDPAADAAALSAVGGGPQGSLVALRSGKAVARVEGPAAAIQADALLAWLTNASAEAPAKTDEKAAGKALQAVYDVSEDTPQGPRILSAAWQASRLGNPEDHFGNIAVVVAQAISDLLAADPKKSADFAPLLADTEKQLACDLCSWPRREEWILLNELLGKSDATFAWFDRIKAAPGSGPTLNHFQFVLRELLRGKGRYADIAAFVPDPAAAIATVEEDYSRTQRLPGWIFERQAEEAWVSSVEAYLGETYAALLAAGREKDAEFVAAKALELCQGGPMADHSAAQIRYNLVRFALNAGQPRAQHIIWLDELEKAESTLRPVNRSNIVPFRAALQKFEKTPK